MNRDPFRLQTDHNWSCLGKLFSHSCVRVLKKTARENTVILRSPHEKIPSLLFPSQHFKKKFHPPSNYLISLSLSSPPSLSLSSHAAAGKRGSAARGRRTAEERGL
ncbi:Os09g0416501 [Oryza sativa Japonica Group]|uniref:Os09g0416501 protein n=2 Tax=Oryza sativa subsp. japonica TaxID=39947 RepID=C7J6I1_ORYSJ|nr:hypothetical protein EE612_047844 [Oryza sativa]BAH94566.1 Os09g0416501 [Oryza sativa Japonica Group]BAT08089.1 Os09g0416501 [Oryza sativa Japonica Group]|eukprot:NP_001175838.1 Os09g0416501 [Oryza sativa Japonica Group]